MLDPPKGHYPGSVKPQAILFDLDDTLLSWGYADDIWRPVCERFARRLDLNQDRLFSAVIEKRDWFWDSLQRYRGRHLGLRPTHMEIVSATLERLNISDSSMAEEMNEFYLRIRESVVRLSAGARDKIGQLRSDGVLLGLVTNGGTEFQRGKIQRFGLAPLFDHILIEEEFGVGKPDERVYRHALNQLGVKPTAAWMVGDHLEWDVEAPQKLGILSIWFDVAGTGLPESSTVKPDRIITSLADLV